MRRHWRSERRRLDAYARVAAQHVAHVDPAEAEQAIRAVARLPRRQREVVLLHVWADLSYEQIARALDIPVGTVRSRLNRARGALAQTPPSWSPPVPDLARRAARALPTAPEPPVPDPARRAARALPTAPEPSRA